MKITLLGGTGLVGSEILKILKETSHTVYVPTRKLLTNLPDNIKHAANDNIVNALETINSQFDSDFIICALGTTIKKAKTKENFIRIDKELPLEIFKRFNTHSNVILISALGANEKSKVFYNRVKGELEKDLKLLGFNSVYIIRPSLIIGERNESRPIEYISQKLLKNINNFVPKNFYKYTCHPASLIADTVLDLLNQGQSSNQIEIEFVK